MKGLIFVLLAGLHAPIFAQKPDPLINDKSTLLSPGETRRHLAHQTIVHLKEGALLVRLQTRSQAIAALTDRGDTAQARVLRLAQEAKNLEIAHAFASEFDFCPVYFFYAEASAQVKERDFEKVSLLNESLKPVSGASIVQSNFLLAEFGNSPPQRSEFFELHYRTANGEWVIERYKDPNKNGSRISGLVVMNNQFQRLSKPFPYLVRTFENTLWRRSEKKAVRKFDKRLDAFAQRRGI